MLQLYGSFSFLGVVIVSTQWDKYKSSILPPFSTYLPSPLHKGHWISTALHPSNHQNASHHMHSWYISPSCLPLPLFLFCTIDCICGFILICFQIQCCPVIPVIFNQQISKGLIRSHCHVWHFQICAAIPPCSNTNHFWQEYITKQIKTLLVLSLLLYWF